jgi:hypothetical protein
MTQLQPLRDALKGSQWKRGDVLVIFGEVFSRGYVNGLIDEAKKAGMNVIYSTVGRRDDNGNLRALTPEELKDKDQPLINIPLEAGFDMEKSSKGISPVDQLQGVKMSEWEAVRLDWDQVNESRVKAVEGFRKRVKDYVAELAKQIPDGANVLFAHTMAGGVPRAKILMPTMNRVFKGQGERYASSKTFWESDLGRLTDQSFMEVTANTLNHLIELTKDLRTRIQKAGGRVSYTAYGYHGTEILMGSEYKWQSYAPYLTGFAKIELEKISERAWQDKIAVTTFNVPEILTNSSSIFLGVEIPLYSLLGAFTKEHPNHPFTKELVNTCKNLLKPECSLDSMLAVANNYFRSDIILKKWTNFAAWPQHNGPEQMELMRNTSSQILDMHKDLKALLTATLSEVVYKACGYVMLHEAWAPRYPVVWVGHDLIEKVAIEQNS